MFEPHRGCGIGLRQRHYPHLREHGVGDVDFLQIQSEDYFEGGGHPTDLVEGLRADVPISMHGVAMGLGDVEPRDEAYLGALERLIARVSPVRVSDHLCWSSWGGKHGHDLWPLPFSEEAIRHVAARISAIQDRLRRRILVENVSAYVALRGAEMSEVEFVCEVIRRADCGVLLDVNNIYVNARNQGLSAEQYVDAIPTERIGEVHLAGHTEHADHVEDTHVGPVPEPVWQLYERLIRRTGPLPTVIEWDSRIPEYGVVAAEATRARELTARVVGRRG